MNSKNFCFAKTCLRVSSLEIRLLMNCTDLPLISFISGDLSMVTWAVRDGNNARWMSQWPQLPHLLANIDLLGPSFMTTFSPAGELRNQQKQGPSSWSSLSRSVTKNKCRTAFWEGEGKHLRNCSVKEQASAAADANRKDAVLFIRFSLIPLVCFSKPCCCSAALTETKFPFRTF